MLKDNYNLLIERNRCVYSRFYINQLLRGALYTVGAVLGLFVLLNVLEYYFYFSTGVRSVMFWSFIALSSASPVPLGCVAPDALFFIWAK